AHSGEDALHEKMVHRLYPEVDPMLDVRHVENVMKKCPDAIPNPKVVQYVHNDCNTPMKLDNNYYRNLMENKELLIVDQHFKNDIDNNDDDDNDDNDGGGRDNHDNNDEDDDEDNDDDNDDENDCIDRENDDDDYDDDDNDNNIEDDDDCDDDDD
ncbi:hypothetical protein KI387_005038, partial [Taxus chinensis]